jgi:hypothetical protein
VAGTIAGVGGNGTGVAGVNWVGQVMGLKFLTATGSGSTADAIGAIDYYTRTAQVSNSGQDFALTNNSWGGGGFSQAVLDAIIAGARQDILFVAAAAMAGATGSATIMTVSPITRPTTRRKPLRAMRR